MKVLVLSLLVAAVMAVPAAASAASAPTPTYAWTRLGGDPVVKRGVYSKAKFASVVASTKGRHIMTQEKINKADQAAIIQAVKDPKNIKLCRLPFDKVVPAVSYGYPVVHVKFDVKFEDPRYRGTPGAPAYCVTVINHFKRVRFGPWKTIKTVKNTDGSETLYQQRVTATQLGDASFGVGLPEKCGNIYPLARGASSSAVAKLQTQKVHVPAPATPTAPVAPAAVFVKLWWNAAGTDITESMAGLTVPLTAQVVHNGIAGPVVNLEGVHPGTPFEVFGAVDGDTVNFCEDAGFAGRHDEGLLLPNGDISQSDCTGVAVVDEKVIPVVDKEWPAPTPATVSAVQPATTPAVPPVTPPAKKPCPPPATKPCPPPAPKPPCGSGSGGRGW